jgi:hypothetical protein
MLVNKSMSGFLGKWDAGNIQVNGRYQYEGVLGMLIYSIDPVYKLLFV